MEEAIVADWDDLKEEDCAFLGLLDEKLCAGCERPRNLAQSTGGNP